MAEKKEKMVTIKLPRPAKGESESQFVGLNGKRYLIKKGVEVEVPEAVAEILLNSEKAEEDAFIYSEKVKSKE